MAEHGHKLVDDEAATDLEYFPDANAASRATPDSGAGSATPIPEPRAHTPPQIDHRDPVYFPRFKLRVSALFNDGPILNFSPPIVANLVRYSEKMAREPLHAQSGTLGGSGPVARLSIHDPSAGQVYPRPYAHRVVARLDETWEPETRTAYEIPESIIAEATVNQCRPKTDAGSVLASAGYVLLAEIVESSYPFSKILSAARVVRPRFRDLTAIYAQAANGRAAHADGTKSYAYGNLETYALKLIDFHQPSREPKKAYLQRFLREVDILNLVHHPNIVNVIEVFPTKDHVCVVMEHALDNLDEYVQRQPDRMLEGVQAAIFFHQLVNAVEYLHSTHVAHRGIKCDKVLIFRNDIVKLTWFGHCRLHRPNETCQTYLGDTQYVPPECATNNHYDPKCVDVWCLGIIVFYMIYGALPFDEGDKGKMIRDMKGRDFRKLNENASSPKVSSLINCLLNPNPTYRMLMRDIKNHSWLASAKQSPQCASPPCTTRWPVTEAFHCFDKCC